MQNTIRNAIFLLLFALLIMSGCSDKNTPDNTQVTWQWQLRGPVNTAYDVDVYDIDLFNTDPSIIASLHERKKKVICYFSAGTYEEWREDAGNFPKEALGNELDKWEGERWLDIRNEAVRNIMLSRLDLAKMKGCDGVEPDNVDGYTNNTGFDLTAVDQLAYNKFLATQAKARGLSIGLKNDLSQIEKLEPYFDFAVNEQCHKYNECDYLLPFIRNNKPVFNAEYAKAYVYNLNGARDELCANSKALKLQTLVLPRKLDDSFRYSCSEEQ